MAEIMMMPPQEFVLTLSMAVGFVLVFGGLFGGMCFRFGWRFLDVLWDQFIRFLKWLSR